MILVLPCCASCPAPALSSGICVPSARVNMALLPPGAMSLLKEREAIAGAVGVLACLCDHCQAATESRATTVAAAAQRQPCRRRTFSGVEGTVSCGRSDSNILVAMLSQ